nr:MAG TPA: hypothetical protein [Caudoviricetes sp.]
MTAPVSETRRAHGDRWRLRQDSNLQPRDCVTLSDMWTQAA